MTDSRPGDRAIAQAFWNVRRFLKEDDLSLLNLIEQKATELDATAAPVVVGEDMVERAAHAYVISASRINGQGYIDHEAMREALKAALSGD